MRSEWVRFVLPLVAFSLLIASIGAFGYRTLAEEIRRETHRTLAVIAEQKRQQIEAWLTETRVDAELYFSDYSQLQMLLNQWFAGDRRQDALLQRMQGLMDKVAQARGWSGLAIVDAQGLTVFTVGEVYVDTHLALIADILSRPRIELVDLYRNPAGEVHYGVLAPIGLAGAAAEGVAYLTWKADDALYPLVESWPVPTRSAETYLVRRDPEGVRFLTPLRHDNHEALDLVLPLDFPALPAARAVQGESGILSGGRDYRGVPVLSYGAPVEGTPWLMLAEIDEVEAYAGIRTITWATGVIMAIGLIFVYSIAFLLWRRERQRRDLLARAHYEQQLQQAFDAAEAANAAKSEFLAHMSHEIRTPMNAVLGLAQVLERDALTPGQREMVERIRSAGQSLLTILNDVLDLSKIEAGQLRLEARPFDLARLLAHLDSLMGQAAREKGLSLRIDNCTPAGMLVGDGLRLEQVLFNLTTNAIKFTERGVVEVRVRRLSSDADETRLRFSIRDSGIGIAPEAMEKLFTPFTQADGGIGRRFGGTGLGLSICKRLVELMGGQIGAESEPGRGSTFWFELPFRHAEADNAGHAPAAASSPHVLRSGPRLQGKHVLVVDDSAMNRDLAERALALEGASATLAADGLQALQLLASRPDGFDAVLMDVQMPVMDGLRATRAIRDELGLGALPIIAFTAGVREDQQIAMRAAGANDVLAKPIDIEQMATLLAQWITPRSTRSAADPEPTQPSAMRREPEPQSALEAFPQPERFPEIPGIDRDAAERRLGRDREMFLDLLQMFADDNADVIRKTRDDLARGDRDSAARRLHTLGSNAGFICALDLMANARTLETAIDEGKTNLDAGLDDLDAEIGVLLSESSVWLKSRGQTL